MGAWRSCGGSTRPAAIRRAGPKIPAAGSPRPAWWPPGSPRTTAGWPATSGSSTACGRRACCRAPAVTLAGAVGGLAGLSAVPAAGRRGVAGPLLDAAAGHARTRGLQPVLDVVAGSEPAIALYERSGWELAGTETATWVTPHR